MKREKFLWALTGDHHEGLKFARRVREETTRLRNLSDPEAVQGLVREAKDFFARDLEAHFLEEEEMTAALEGRLPEEGEGTEVERALIRRLFAEHRDLKGFVGQGDLESLASFADLLTEHIRFEENVFFNLLEKWLVGPEKEAWKAALRRPRTLEPLMRGATKPEAKAV